MKLYTVLLLLPLFFLCTTLVHADQKLIKSTCEKLANDSSNVDYAFCVSAFASSKSRKTDTLRDLGSVSLRLVKRDVTNTRRMISHLIKHKKQKPYVKEILTDCLELYTDAVDSVKEGMKSYKGQMLDEANVRMSSVMSSVTTCEDGFEERPGVVSPITKRSCEAFQLSAISLSIMHLVQIDSKH